MTHINESECTDYTPYTSHDDSSRQTILNPPSRNLNPHYRGRVRSGCLTCRAKKVKCDEQRPVCQRCTRLRRSCVYKVRSVSSSEQPATCHVNSPIERHGAAAHRSTGISTQDPIFTPQQDDLLDQDSPSTIFHWLLSPSGQSEDSETFTPFQRVGRTPDNADIFDTTTAVSMMTSQDIYLCTTIDRLAALEAQNRPSFSVFLNEVHTPILSTFDPINWNRFKTYAVQLAMHHKGISTALLALQLLYKARKNNIPISKAAWNLFRTAKSTFATMLQNNGEDFEIVLVVVFLLCLFEMLTFAETGSSLGDIEPDSTFAERMNAWSWRSNSSCLSKRILTWLRLIHIAGRRGGNPGILSEPLLGRLPQQTDLSSLAELDISADAASILGDHIRSSIFSFYVQLQEISLQVGELSHYHRSRTKSEDQDEVSACISRIKNQLQSLWDARPSLMTLSPADVRIHFSQMISEPLINLIGLCIAAYHAEIVEIGRTLSDPPLASTEAKRAMQEIRTIISGDWVVYVDDGRLNSGYLRPLFLYAIESIRREEAQWAIDCLREIKDPICNSDFFASFAEELTAAQRSKRRRVASKFFCLQTFGIAPPFLV